MEKLMLAAILVASGLATSPASAPWHYVDLFSVNAYLCESAEYAMDFAAAVADNEQEEYAKNVVGKIAKREVCGRYIGVASIQEQKVIINGGILYKLTSLRFTEDNKVAWVAERVFAVEGNPHDWHL
jgi:hypothetical protein